MTGAETLQRLTALQSSRLLQLVAECKRLAGLAGIRDYSVPGLDAPPAVVTERWRAEMPKFEPITEQWRYAFAPEKVIADYKRANAELDAAEAEVTALRRENAELKQDVAELRFCLRTASNRNAAETENRELRDKVAGLELEAEAAHERIAALEARILELTEPPAIGQLWKVLSSGRVYRIVGDTNDGRDLELLFDPSKEVPIGTRAWVPHSWFAPGVVRHVPSTEGGEG